MIDEFEKRIEAIRTWKGPEHRELEVVDFTPYILESFKLITDLFDPLQAYHTKLKELRKELECWGKMLEIYGINDERMSAALSFAFGDGDSPTSYLENMLSLSEKDLDWYRETHGAEGEE